MGKKASRKIGNKKSNLIVESKKVDSKEQENKQKKVEALLLEFSDSEIEALFEMGKITQDEYEYILLFRKSQKSKKKTSQEKFEERIRCNNIIIQKVINLGRKFRIQDLLQKQDFKSARKMAQTEEEINLIEEEQDIEKGERLRDNNRNKNKEERTRGSNGRSRDTERFGGRGRERDR